MGDKMRRGQAWVWLWDRFGFVGKTVAIFLVCLALCSTSFAAGFYRYNVDDLARKARKRIQEIEKKIEGKEIAGGLQQILAELKPLFDEAEELYSVRKWEEAAELYGKIEKISKKKEVKEWLEKAEDY